MRFFLITLISYTLCFSPLGQVEPESRDLARSLKKELDFNIEFTSLILRVGAKIDKDISGSDKDATLKQVLELEEGKLEEILKNRVMEFAEFYEQQITLPTEKRGLFRKYFPLFQWSNLADMLKQTLIGTQGFFKRKGIGVALGIGLGFMTEWSSYFILYSFGMAKFIPIAAAIPYGTILTTVPTAINYFIMKGKLKNILGGKVPYKAYKQQMKETLKALKLKSPEQILFPLSNLATESEGTLSAVVLSKKTWIDNFLLKLGMEPKRLSYPTLKVFMVVNGISSPAIKWVQGHEGIPYYLKTALISDLILRDSDENIKAKFLTTFSGSFVEISRAPYWKDLKKWTQELMKAKKVERILELMAEIPSGVAPTQIIELWERIILPHYSTEFDLSYASYRKLREEITLLKAYIQNDGAPNWNSRFYQEFSTRLADALKISIPTCKSPETTILKYLLQLK